MKCLGISCYLAVKCGPYYCKFHLFSSIAVQLIPVSPLYEHTFSLTFAEVFKAKSGNKRLLGYALDAFWSNTLQRNGAKSGSAHPLISRQRFREVTYMARLYPSILQNIYFSFFTLFSLLHHFGSMGETAAVFMFSGNAYEASKCPHLPSLPARTHQRLQQYATWLITSTSGNNPTLWFFAQVTEGHN